MARISSSLNISFFPTTAEGVDELTSWKKARQEYVRTLGHHLLEFCSDESKIIEVFDYWEHQISELVKADKTHNCLTALMMISLLHYFSRSYDQVKEHVPFVASMLQHKRSRTVSCAAALVFKWLARELPDNIEFLRDLVTNSVSNWIETSTQTRFAALLILDVAGKFILPNVFAVTSNKFIILWSSAICDDVGLRIVASKVIDTHLNGLPSATMVEKVHCLFDDCLKQFQSPQPSNHGPVLICLSIVKKFSDDVIFTELDMPKLVNLLLEVVTIKSELLIFTAFSLLYKISQKLSHLFTPDTVRIIFTNLIAGCQRFITSTRLFKMIDCFIGEFNPLLIPVQLIVDFLKMIVRSPKYRAQQNVGFEIIQTIFDYFKEVNVPASFFLDAEPSPQYIDALRRRMALFNDTKSTLLKYYNDGIGAKVSKNQAVLSLHILKAFDSHLFKNKNVVYQQIKIFTRSSEEGVRLLVAEVLPLFGSQSALDDLLFLALFDESKSVRASAVKQLQHPALLAHSEMLPHILDDPSFKVRRNAIPLIAKVTPLNPMLFIVPISSFVQHVMLSMASSSDPFVCAKISTLFPLVAEHFLPLCPAFIPQVAKICFSFLDSRGNENIYIKTTLNTSATNINNSNINDINNNNINDIKMNNIHHIKMNNVIHRDILNDGHALISNQLPFDQNFPNLRRIFHIENQEWIDNRDANLFLTIQKLAARLSPFLSELVQIFTKVFSGLSSDRVLSSALDALTEISLKMSIASNLPTTNPELFPILMKLLRKQPSPTVAVKILKVMGTFGVTSFPLRNNINFNVVEKSKGNLLDPITEFDFKSASFYTDFTMTSLLKTLSEPHSSIFEAITAIFAKEGDRASKFLGTIMDAFSRSLSTSKGIQKDILFNQLEIISYFSGARIEPYVKVIMPHMMANVGIASSMRLAFVLSYLLKSEFIPFAQPLFQAAIRMLQRLPEDMKYNDILLKFISASIIFQNQPIDQFITECERAFQENVSDQERVLLIVESLITVVQLGDASFECAHITRICIQLIPKINIRMQVFQLLFSLCVYCQLSPDVIEFLSPKDESISILNNITPFNRQLHFLKEYLKDRSLSTENFLIKYTISVQLNIPDYIPLSKQSQLSVFSNFPPPQFSNTEKWLEDLCCAVVSESPSIAIRACHKIVKHSPSFRSDIFPIAFLSCWRIARQEDKKIFSSLILQIFEGEDTTNPTFLSLAELLVRAGHPLIISNFTIASACQSPAMALRFLVRHFREHPTDLRAVELMLTINMRLGRTDSSTGILKTVKLPTAGTWWEKLGDWKSALNIYRQNISKYNLTNTNSDNNDFINNTKLASQILRCYARLEKWEEIRNMFKVFEHMNHDEKKENAVWFAWAFYRINDLQKVSYFVNKFDDTEDLNLMLFKEIFLVASAQNKSAKAFIEKSMHILVRDCSVYSALNASQADENLTYANYMVELEEALEYKETRDREIVKRWRRRLQFHTGDSYSWMRLVEIRNLAVLPYENKKTYLKLMSVLVKERRFELVNTFWNGMLKSIHEPAVQISYHKLLWALEKKREAICSLHLLNLLYDSEVTLTKFKEEFDQIPYALKEPFIANIEKSEFVVGKADEMNTMNTMNTINTMNTMNTINTINTMNTMNTAENLFAYGQMLRKKIILTPKIRSRFFRIEGAFRAQLYQKNESLDSLVQTMDLFERAANLIPDDYRNWAELAYAAIRAISDESFVVKAMNGFLRATQLLQTNNLEYLCQLFSLFFRYGGTVTIPDEIVNLNPEIVIQILPQIVCQINHNEPSVRNVVHELLSRFSDNHFQALVFSLHLLIGSEDKEKSTIASELLLKLGLKHIELSEEAAIFVDGMLRSAITWYELWMTRLDSAFLESRRDYSNGTQMLKNLFNTANNPKCQLDRQFVKLMESPLATCNNTLRHFQPTEASFNTLWTQLKRFYEIVKEKFKRLETIELSSVSEELAKKRNFLLSIPGTYIVNGKSPLIKRIDQTLPILTTQQHPRLLYMTDTDGLRWKFLLKGNEDLRLDQRIMQFFNLINSLLSTNKLTADLGVSISKYAIVPFHPNAGLISWVTGADTLHQLVMEYRKSNLIPLWYENDLIQQTVGERFDMLSALQKAEVWEMIAPHCPANELHETFWERTPDAVSWIQNVDTFVLSTALMSIAGYVIGLGDRHPSNIMIQRQTGHVVHIDFGDSFEVALNRERMPEKVPFRLTRLLINAFGVARIEGVFRSACEKIMRILRDNKSSIIAQLEIFVHEPIFVNKDNGLVGEGQTAILDRVIEKLSGKDPHTFPRFSFSSCRKIDDDEIEQNGNKENGFGKRVELKVEEQVDELIRVAADPYRYVLHYIGWCQFW